MSSPSELDERAAHDEQARLQALRDLELLDTAPEPQFDRLTRLVSTCLQVPICLLSIVDTNRLWFKSRMGFEAPGYPKRDGFCHHVVADRAPLICLDLSQDARFAEHDLVQHGQGPIQFYAGMPLRFADQIVGTLCVMDHVARPDFDAARQNMLAEFAETVCDAIRARQLKLCSQRERALFADGPMAAVIWDADARQPRIQYASENLARIIGEAGHAAALKEGSLEPHVLKADVDELRVALRSHAETRLPRLETVLRLAEGNRWVMLQSSADYADDGALLRIRGYLTDISRQKQLESSIEATKERLYLALESAQIGTWELNLQTHERLHSERTAAMLGFRSDELETDDHAWRNRIHPYDRGLVEHKVELAVRRAAETPDAPPPVFSIEYRIRHRRGHYIWVQSCGKLVARDARSAAPQRVVGTLLDITASKTAELERQQQQQLLDLLNQIQHGFLHDKSLNSACHALFEPLLRMTESQFGFIGVTETDGAGRMLLKVPSITNITWDEASQAWYDAHMRANESLAFTNLDNLFGHVVTHNTVVCTNQPYGHTASRGTPPGHPRLDSFLGIPLRHDNQVVGMVALGNRPGGFDDALVQRLEPLTVTLGTLIHARRVEEQRVQAEEQLRQLATQDPLTGLANRRRFFDMAEQTLGQCRRYDTPATVALLDLDHFKQVNDRYGHAAGDAVLRAFAEAMRASLRDTDLPARIGGEEFAVLMPSTDLAGAMIPLERLRAALAAAPVSCLGHDIPVTVSIGVSAWHAGQDTPDTWLASADEALYRAKAEGRNRIAQA